MAKGGLFTGQLRGKLMEVVWYRRGGENVTRGYNKYPRNANTKAQINQRSQLTNIIRLYQSSPVFFKKAFQNKSINQTDYNALVSRNLNKGVKVYLTKEVAAANGGVVAPYIISDGSLTPIITSGQGVDAVTSLAVGADFVIDGTTQVGALAEVLLANNTIVQAGDQLSYVSVEQYNYNGTPRIRTRIFEMPIDVADTRLVFDVMPEQAMNVVGGFIAHGELVYTGAFAWVLSRKTTNGLQVSRQSLICTSDSLYSAYTGTDAATRAEVSYNVSKPPFLDPDSDANGSAVPSVQYSIAQVSIGGTNLTDAVSEVEITSSQIATGGLVITGSGLSDVANVSLSVQQTVNSPLEGETTNELTVQVPVEATGDTKLTNTGAIELTNFTAVDAIIVSIGGRRLFSWNTQGASSGQDPTPLG